MLQLCTTCYDANGLCSNSNLHASFLLLSEPCAAGHTTPPCKTNHTSLSHVLVCLYQIAAGPEKGSRSMRPYCWYVTMSECLVISQFQFSAKLHIPSQLTSLTIWCAAARAHWKLLCESTPTAVVWIVFRGCILRVGRI